MIYHDRFYAISRKMKKEESIMMIDGIIVDKSTIPHGMSLPDGTNVSSLEPGQTLYMYEDGAESEIYYICVSSIWSKTGNLEQIMVVIADDGQVITIAEHEFMRYQVRKE